MRVFDRLSRIDLPERLDGVAPRILVQFAVAAGLLATVVLFRGVINLATPGVAPFSLLYPAILIATLTAGGGSGAMLLCMGGGMVWFFLLQPADHRPSDLMTIVLYALAGGAIIAVAEAQRAGVRALREETARRIAAREQAMAEQLQGRAALHDTEARLELATAAAGIGIWEWLPRERRVVYSAEARAICGFSPDEPLTLGSLIRVIHEDDLARIREQVALNIDPTLREAQTYEYRLNRPDGKQRWIIVRGRAIFERGEEGEVLVRWVGALQDITGRKAAEDRLRLLAREVDHRANNLLAVVQGAVQLSRADTVDGLRTTLIGRIRALGRAHQLLSQARWEGADLRRLVEEELAAFNLGQPNRTWIDGPDIALSPAAAQGVAMALHELATNAAKYGALSTDQGQVAVTWERDAGGALKVLWAESGGPPVTPPTRRGLGTTMLERALSGPVRGTTRIDWLREGVVCAMEFHEDAGRLKPATT